MLGGLGINIDLIFAVVFVLGIGLVGLVGVIGVFVFNFYFGLDFEIMIFILVVVVVGGLGILRGVLLGSLLIGMVDIFGKVLLLEFFLFLIFVVMVLILFVCPVGLFSLNWR